MVDDDPGIRRLVELRFQLDDFDVFSTGEPEEAVRLAGSERPDALVLDVMMPGMDGFEVCRRVRSGNGGGAGQPVIVMLTARAGTESMVTGLAAGADDYVVKPPNLDELVERVRSRLRQRAHAGDGSVLAQLGGGAQIAGEIARRLDSGASPAAPAARARQPVAVGCVDLRRFEGFNLRYGYDRGDDVLEWLAGLLVDAGRTEAGTFVGRLGSDDFVVIADQDGLGDIATRFEARYLGGIDSFYDPADVARNGIDVVDDRGRTRRDPVLSFSFGAALSSELPSPDPKALLELAVERSRSLRLRARNSIAIGPSA